MATTTLALTSVPTSSNLPIDLPLIIQPLNGSPPAPADSVLVQVGWTNDLNYPYVVGNQDAVTQIFTYLPQGIAYGLDISETNVVMQYLQPFNTSLNADYITTLAMLYVPSNDVNALASAMLNPFSKLFSNPSSQVNTLMSMINPSIPLLAGTSGSGSNPNTVSTTTVAPSSTSSPTESPLPIGHKTKVAGWAIALVLLGVITLCLGVQFLVCLRRRRRAKRQAASLESAPSFSYHSGKDKAVSSETITTLSQNFSIKR